MTEEDKTELAIAGAVTGVVVVWGIARHIKRARIKRIREKEQEEWLANFKVLVDGAKDRTIEMMRDPETGIAAGLRHWMEQLEFINIVQNTIPE